MRMTAVLESHSVATTGADLNHFVRKILNIVQNFLDAKRLTIEAKVRFLVDNHVLIDLLKISI